MGGWEKWGGQSPLGRGSEICCSHYSTLKMFYHPQSGLTGIYIPECFLWAAESTHAQQDLVESHAQDSH